MGIYRRGQTWWGRFQHQGQEVRESLETASRREANRLFDEWRADKLRQLRLKADDGHTWDEACSRYVREVMPDSVRPETAKRYLVSFRATMDVLSERGLRSIGRKEMLAIANRAGPSVATRRRDLTAVSQVFRAAVVWGWCERNPVREFDAAAVMRERRDPIVLPGDLELDLFFAACHGELARMARVLLLTGLRLSEATSLRWPQVMPAGAQPHLSITGKRNKLRAVPITPAAQRLIMATPRHIRSSYVFWHGNGEPYRQASTQLALVKRRLGLAFRTHDLRHRFAVDYLRAGGSIYRLQKILGHSNLAVTEVYLEHVTPEEAERAREGEGVVEMLG